MDEKVLRKILNKQRTLAQNRSLHLVFTQIANRMVCRGVDLKALMEIKEVSVPMTADLVKETMWRPIQKAITGKESSTQLTTKEIDQIFEPLQKVLNEKLGLEIEFPSIETMMAKQYKLTKNKGDK